ncbi:hypothetical protein Ae201684P_016757 [Aphanomyces euteiches]|uniref:Uncharacterized protein n=1 Tax=Aphanomyces euteiches TaxID=100861 RepID=A0A6G0WMY0_9STRA|nr:hypothetical protein Ae201684_013631 [Aphanomyces euteiches]KAH9094145.1 hypothetical protein Ae201684P_016757 [Aphanomyces euteiches]
MQQGSDGKTRGRGEADADDPSWSFLSSRTEREGIDKPTTKGTRPFASRATRRAVLMEEMTLPEDELAIVEDFHFNAESDEFTPTTVVHANVSVRVLHEDAVANWTFAEALECFQETIQDSDHFNSTCAVIG